MDHHRNFLWKSLAGTVLKSKMVRTLTELKVLVYEFSKHSESLDIDEAEYPEIDTPKHAGSSSAMLHFIPS